MVKIKLAIPTKGEQGLDDVVSEVFGRSKNFTIIEIIDNSIVNVNVIKNPVISYKYGVGPIIVKMLADMGVTAVAAPEFGLGVSTLLEQNRIRKFNVNSNISVREAVQKVIQELNR